MEQVHTGDLIGTRLTAEMVGISKEDLEPSGGEKGRCLAVDGLLSHLFGSHALHGSFCSYGHEDWGEHIAVRKSHDRGSRSVPLPYNIEFERRNCFHL